MTIKNPGRGHVTPPGGADNISISSTQDAAGANDQLLDTTYTVELGHSSRFEIYSISIICVSMEFGFRLSESTKKFKTRFCGGVGRINLLIVIVIIIIFFYPR